MFRLIIPLLVGVTCMFGLGFPELVLITVVVVLLFGTKRLPELGSGLGKAITNFRNAFKDGQSIDVTPPKEEDKTNKP